jgi:hypothetical protein
MRIRLETSVDYFLLFIVVIKFIFVLTAVSHIILSHSTNKKAAKSDPKLVYWRERTEFIFIISMAILLIYHFNPIFPEKYINSETSLLFFMFGFVLIITADWNIFVTESPWYKRIVSIIT